MEAKVTWHIETLFKFLTGVWEANSGIERWLQEQEELQPGAFWIVMTSTYNLTIPRTSVLWQRGLYPRQGKGASSELPSCNGALRMIGRKKVATMGLTQVGGSCFGSAFKSLYLKIPVWEQGVSKSLFNYSDICLWTELVAIPKLPKWRKR